MSPLEALLLPGALVAVPLCRAGTFLPSAVNCVLPPVQLPLLCVLRCGARKVQTELSRGCRAGQL